MFDSVVFVDETFKVSLVVMFDEDAPEKGAINKKIKNKIA